MGELKDEVKKIYNDMLGDLLTSKEGKEAWEKAENIVKPVLESWAKAKWDLLAGTDEEKEIAKLIVDNCKDSLNDVKSALLAQLSNYLVDKLFEELRRIAEKALISVIVK